MWCERSFFTLQSLPSSIGQSIRLKCRVSEGCEFDPHGGPFSFICNTNVTGGSPREDLLPSICKSPSVIGQTRYERLESTCIQTLAWCDRSFFILQSLPSSIGQSIRLKCVESEGCEFDPHGGLFSFKNVYVTGGSPQEDLLLYASTQNFVIQQLLRVWL